MAFQKGLPPPVCPYHAGKTPCSRVTPQPILNHPNNIRNSSKTFSVDNSTYIDVPGTPQTQWRLSPLLCPLAIMLCEANPSREKTLELNHHPRVNPVIHHQNVNIVSIQTFHKELPHWRYISRSYMVLASPIILIKTWMVNPEFQP